MNRRRFLAATALAVMMPRRLFAQDEELPACPDLDTSYGNWKIEFYGADQSSLIDWEIEPISKRSKVRIKTSNIEWVGAEEGVRDAFRFYLGSFGGRGRRVLGIVTYKKKYRPLDVTIYLDGKSIAENYNNRGIKLILSEDVLFDADQIKVVLDSHNYYFKAIIDLDGLHGAVRKAEKRSKKLNRMIENRECSESDCFVTTATCQVVGLKDNCFELTQLRKFRDKYLMKLQNGEKDIKAYYDLAPNILPSLSKYNLLSLYFTYIIPCSLLSYFGFNRATYHLYKRMMGRLSIKYLAQQ